MLVQMIHVSFRSRRLFGFLLLLLTAAAVGALLRGGEHLYFGPIVSDLSEQFYLWRVFLARWLHRGIFPFWDMHAFGGYPVIEILQNSLFHPVSLFSALLFSPAFGLKLWMAGNVAVALCGSYVALRRGLRLLPGWAFVGACVYVFGGAFATRVEAGHFAVVGATALWVPALAAVWKAARALSGGFVAGVCRSRAAIVGAIVANGLVVLAGSPQYVVYLFYVELLAVLIAAGAGRRLPALVLLAAIWLDGLALSAPQWFPTLFYLPFTGRSSGNWMTPPSVADRWNFLIEALLPFPLGDDLNVPHMHLKNVWETCSYPGTISWVLAWAGLIAVACWRKRRPWPAELKLAWGIVLLGLYLCGGGWLPGFSSFREPMKARAVVGLGVALAAATGGQLLYAGGRLRASQRGRMLRPAILVAALWGSVALGGSLWLPKQAESVGRWLLAGGPPIDALRGEAWQRVSAQPALMVPPVVEACQQVAAWAAIAAVLTVGLRWRPQRFATLLCVAAVLDPFSTSFRVFVSRHPFTNIGLPPQFREAIGKQLEQTRAAGKPPWRVTLPPSLANRGHLVDGLWDTGGYDPLMPRDANTRVALHTKRLDLSIDDRRTTIALALGRRYDFSRWMPELGEPLGELARWEVAPAAALFTLERQVRPGYEGLGSFGPNVDDGRHHVDVAPPPQEGFRQPAEAVRTFAHRLDGEATRPGASSDHIEVLAVDSPNEYAYRVTCARPALALFRTTWLPGWQVWMDGRYWGRPWCANRWMLAAPIEPGSHEIRWRYRPVGLWFSLGVSFFSCLALLAILAARPVERRKK
ncbi:MAG: hypothetical protein ACP5UB_11765 [Candidatus Sumerlaeaceae bacterium]